MLRTLHGFLRRRILVNYRVDPEVMARYLPAPFRPKIYYGHAIAGICLLRLERMRPAWMPPFLGFTLENATHRVAVEWDDPSGGTREGVFIPRRDTRSRLCHLAGGRFLPGEHHLADFDIIDASSRLDISVRALDGGMSLELDAYETSFLTVNSCFRKLSDASAFFQRGVLRYSPTRDPGRFEGLRLEIPKWHVLPIAVEHVASSFFSDEKSFPPGTAVLDHALIMRDTPLCYESLPDVSV